MTHPSIAYCTRCGRPGNRRTALCSSCGASRVMTPQEHAGHVAFMLNELHLPPMTEVLHAPQRDAIARHYETEVWRLLAPSPAARLAPAASTALATPPEAGAADGRLQAAPTPGRAAPPPVPPATPREPFDWGWLAEQQANLMLFAGAFLTVIAALIYVGYSGQAVSGPLKMSVLAAYTLAFLIAGVLCLGIPRVEMAGRVFFGLGAILVPMNFVAARSIFSDSDLSAQSLWLAGSIVTAGFYAAVAWTGLGRVYAAGSGLAIVSATAAAVVVSDIPIEWAALPFIAVAFAMVMSGIAGPKDLRDRLGSTWQIIGQIVAVLAAGFTLAIALFEGVDGGFDATTRWFLPLTLVTFAGAAAGAAWQSRRAHLAAASLIAATGAGITTAYALSLPAEGWAITSAATTAAIGALLAGSERTSKQLPRRAQEAGLAAAMASLALSAFISFVVMQAHTEGIDLVANRWFLATSFVLALAFFASTATMERGRREWGPLTSIGIAACSAGAWIATIFAFSWPVDAYAMGVAAIAPLMGLAAVSARHPRIATWLPRMFQEVTLAGGAASALTATYITALVAGRGDAVVTPWFAVITFALIAAFFALVAVGLRHRIGAAGVALSATAMALATVYALDVSVEYYAFALLVPAIVSIAAVRFALARVDRLLDASWRDDVLVVARCATLAGAALALSAVLATETEAGTWEAQSRVFLPIALALSALVAGIDASRGCRFETSAALAIALAATAFSLPYVFNAHAAWYGAALTGAGIALAIAGRAMKLGWIESEAFDFSALAAVLLGTVPFESAYVEHPSFGAGVHFAAAVFFASAALVQRSRLTLADVIDAKQLAGIPLTTAWVYPAGLSAAAGYVFTLRALATGPSEGGSLAIPLMTVSVAFMVTAMALRAVRPEMRGHLYVLSLLTAVASLTASNDATMLAALTLVYVAAWLAAGAFEDSPFIAAPAAAFLFIAVPAWLTHLDTSDAMLPLVYSAVGLATYSLAVVLRTALPRWSVALRIAGGAFAITAPAVGFVLLSEQNDPAAETSALYQWSTFAVAAGGLIAWVEALVAGRRWLIVPASAVLTFALLLQIARLQPDNAQAYSAVIGAYLVLLGAVGLSRLKLIPELAPYSEYVEAVGAATIMLPSFAQSLQGGWHYQWILLIEATLFLVAAVTLRRRGLLVAAVTFLVLVAARALFDAVNALPNWIVVALCGAALLAGGVAILAGRDRWDRWQQAIIGWWAEMDPDSVLNGR